MVPALIGAACAERVFRSRCSPQRDCEVPNSACSVRFEMDLRLGDRSGAPKQFPQHPRPPTSSKMGRRGATLASRVTPISWSRTATAVFRLGIESKKILGGFSDSVINFRRARCLANMQQYAHHQVTPK